MVKFWSFSVVDPVKVDPGGELFPPGSESLCVSDGPSKLFKLVADWNPDSWLCWSFLVDAFSVSIKIQRLGLEKN